MPHEYPGYHDLQERLASWRREILVRMDRADELAVLPRWPRRNLAAEAVVTVDSHLGTVNTADRGAIEIRVEDPAGGVVRPTTIPFAVEAADHPVLRQLRERFDLDAVAGDGTDLERMVRLRDWIKSLFPHYIPYRMPEWNALVILDRGARGVERFICVHYSVALVQCALALGLQGRVVNLHRGIAADYRIGDEAVADPPVDEHVVAEIWSREVGGWVMMDTDFDCHYERDGRPASALDIHDAFVSGRVEELTPRRGPHSQSFTALAEDIGDDSDFFARELPSYYAHVSVLMRNDFLSDPDGPVTIAHLVDEHTEPILWHRGSDNRLQPHLMGPVVVATPWTDRVALLTDGVLTTSWASTDAPVPHQVELAWERPLEIARVVLHWPEHAGTYRTSRRVHLVADHGHGWSDLTTVEIDPEAPFTVVDLDPVSLVALRVRQEPGDGSTGFPDRLWLTQVVVLGPGCESAVPVGT